MITLSRCRYFYMRMSIIRSIMRRNKHYLLIQSATNGKSVTVRKCTMISSSQTNDCTLQPSTSKPPKSTEEISLEQRLLSLDNEHFFGFVLNVIETKAENDGEIMVPEDEQFCQAFLERFTRWLQSNADSGDDKYLLVEDRKGEMMSLCLEVLHSWNLLQYLHSDSISRILVWFEDNLQLLPTDTFFKCFHFIASAAPGGHDSPPLPISTDLAMQIVDRGFHKLKLVSPENLAYLLWASSKLRLDWEVLRPGCTQEWFEVSGWQN